MPSRWQVVFDDGALPSAATILIVTLMPSAPCAQVRDSPPVAGPFAVVDCATLSFQVPITGSGAPLAARLPKNRQIKDSIHVVPLLFVIAVRRTGARGQEYKRRPWTGLTGCFYYISACARVGWTA